MVEALQALGVLLLGSSLRYFIFASLAWLLAYVFFKRRWAHRKVNPDQPSRSDVWRELRWSISSLFVYGAIAGLTYALVKNGWTGMYFEIAEYGWLWFFASIAAAIVIHDTYFYWTHRAMHHRRLFKIFHRIHHLSTNPSPWAAYAFSPLEAVVQALIIPLIAFLIPIHPVALLAFSIWQVALNVAGHTGYEYGARGFMGTWASKLINTPTHHVQHHETFRGNYGLYFNYWDRLMGTNHPDYEERFHEVTHRNVKNTETQEVH